MAAGPAHIELASSDRREFGLSSGPASHKAPRVKPTGQQHAARLVTKNSRPLKRDSSLALLFKKVT